MRALRRYVPAGVKQRIRHSRLYVKHRSTAQNVYFTCVQKTASRWLRRLLNDERVYRASGLEYFDYMATLSWHDPERRSMTEIILKSDDYRTELFSALRLSQE